MEPLPPGRIRCPHCTKEIDELSIYCQYCGKKIVEKPISTGALSQILLYAVSLFLPPLGIGYTIRYLKSPNEQAKRIGMISLALTIGALIVTIWLSLSFFNDMTKQFNATMNSYQLP